MQTLKARLAQAIAAYRCAERQEANAPDWPEKLWAAQGVATLAIAVRRAASAVRRAEETT